MSACALPPVTTQSQPQANAASNDSSVRDAPVSADRDGGSVKTSDSSEPPALTNNGMPRSDASAADGGMSRPDASAGDGANKSSAAAGQAGGAGVSGSEANLATAGASGAASAGGAPAMDDTKLGKACRFASECPTGNCSDGVCCKTPCQSTCSRCNTQGECETLDDERDPDTCSASHNICLRGACLFTNGSECATDYECASGICDGRSAVRAPAGTPLGRCCTRRCPTCSRCNVDGAACSPASGAACSDNGVCDASGDCIPR